MSYSDEELNQVTETQEILVFYDANKKILNAISLGDVAVAVPPGIYSNDPYIANPLPANRGVIQSMSSIGDAATTVNLPKDYSFGVDVAMSQYDTVNLDVVGVNAGGFRVKWRGAHQASSFSPSGVVLSFRNILKQANSVELPKATYSCYKEFGSAQCSVTPPILAVTKQSVQYNPIPGMTVQALFEPQVGGIIYFTDSINIEGVASCKITQVYYIDPNNGIYGLALLGFNSIPKETIDSSSFPRYVPGCDKTVETCISYNNKPRFGGFDQVPGNYVRGWF